jgi:histidine triad (HIT) family protein
MLARNGPESTWAFLIGLRECAVAYDQNNIFAKILRGEMAAQKFFEDERTIAILDVMPQSEGHSLVIPKCAAENIFALEPAFASAVMHTGQQVARAVQNVFQADGITLMQFNGAEAGQTVFHFHLHVIPRYAGQPLRSHGRSFADPAMLAEHAARLRTALGTG